jgi:hypothetical protein
MAQSMIQGCKVMPREFFLTRMRWGAQRFSGEKGTFSFIF